MRHFLAPAFALSLAACASAPSPQPARSSSRQPAARPTGGSLIGLDANDLVRRFGQPAFQVHEGPGTKLQWAGGGCVLDAYLYPPESGSGMARVDPCRCAAAVGRGYRSWLAASR